ncbi:hypothetical protein HMPREF0762_00692 [Slackia exigua ATCC 700122]|uniref:Uncharacterized protein n=1 Tax=Slackia exigua (strain ATCC 700122 / DSM 15923 / CIP 105133 / JCM 11022 / KCTC 5966 / S-7) TaxID=649764 RepID=D0WFU2_SLAES|nr:hypothetical protein HMPREF0762_00692 [Slackia exigua ATCC 700122]
MPGARPRSGARPNCEATRSFAPCACVMPASLVHSTDADGCERNRFAPHIHVAPTRPDGRSS